MAIKKSDLYSSLWASCDELRGGMDASQYKDPHVLNGHPEAIALFNNLASIPAATFVCPIDDDGKATLALELDQAMREQAPAGWKGDDTREKQVLNALFPIMSRDRVATQAIFEIIKNQPGY